MIATQKVLRQSPIPSPEEIYSNYCSDKNYYPKEYLPEQSGQQVKGRIDPSALPLPSLENTCWRCSSSNQLQICKQCRHYFCNTCNTKPTHKCNQ